MGVLPSAKSILHSTAICTAWCKNGFAVVQKPFCTFTACTNYKPNTTISTLASNLKPTSITSPRDKNRASP
ncbi:hypothetical protein LguiA_004737 [Lonicera macranthoides]